VAEYHSDFFACTISLPVFNIGYLELITVLIFISVWLIIIAMSKAKRTKKKKKVPKAQRIPAPKNLNDKEKRKGDEELRKKMLDFPGHEISYLEEIDISYIYKVEIIYPVSFSRKERKVNLMTVLSYS
jgi:hypothetical protein